MVENISIFDFKLDESAKTAIARLDKGKSLFYDPQDTQRIKWFNSKEYGIIKL